MDGLSSFYWFIDTKIISLFVNFTYDLYYVAAIVLIV